MGRVEAVYYSHWNRTEDRESSYCGYRSRKIRRAETRYLTATVTGALWNPATVRTKGTASLGVILWGHRHSLDRAQRIRRPIRRRKPGRVFPPMLTVTGLVVIAGGDEGAALPVATGGFTGPSPAQ